MVRVEELLREPTAANVAVAEVLPAREIDFCAIYEGVRERLRGRLGDLCLVAKQERYYCRSCGCLGEPVSYRMGKLASEPLLRGDTILIPVRSCMAQEGEGTSWKAGTSPIAIHQDDFPCSYRDELCPMDWEERGSRILQLQRELARPVMSASFCEGRLQCYTDHIVQILVGGEVNDYFLMRDRMRQRTG